MKKVCLYVLFLATLTAGAVNTTFAWDEVGHKITAYIAWQQMTPAVRDAVIKLLTSAPETHSLRPFMCLTDLAPRTQRKCEFFMLAATWPDIIRDRNFDTRFKKYAHSNWHYTDTAWTVKDGKVQQVSLPGEGGLALEKIIEFIKLESNSSTRTPIKGSPLPG